MKVFTIHEPIYPELLYCDPVARPNIPYGCSIVMFGSLGWTSVTFDNTDPVTVTKDIPSTTLIRLGNAPPLGGSFHLTNLNNLTHIPLTGMENRLLAEILFEFLDFVMFICILLESLSGSPTQYILHKGRARRMMKILQVRGFTSLGGDITIHVIKPVLMAMSQLNSQKFRAGCSSEYDTLSGKCSSEDNYESSRVNSVLLQEFTCAQVGPFLSRVKCVLQWETMTQRIDSIFLDKSLLTGN